MKTMMCGTCARRFEVEIPLPVPVLHCPYCVGTDIFLANVMNQEQALQAEADHLLEEDEGGLDC